MKIILFLLTSVLFVFSCNNKKENEEDEYVQTATGELTQLNIKYDSALINADTAQLNRIYADEFSYTTPEGHVRNKNEQLTFLKSGGLDLEFGKSEDVAIKVYDSTAVVTGTFNGKGVFKESIIDIRERYTTVWVKKDGEWRLVKEHSTFIK